MDNRRMCPNCRAFITTDDKTCPYCEVAIGPKAIDRRSPGDMFGIPGDRLLTTAILGFNTLLYLAMILRDAQASRGGIQMDPSSQALVDFGGKWAPYIFQRGQWWRLITAGFLHGGILHIGMNSWVLYELGRTVDDTFGRYRYITIYLIASAAGFGASLYWSPYSLSIGASAGITGLIGAMVALGTKEKHSMIGAMRGQYVQWMVIVLIQGFIISGIDNAAHIGGFIGGFIVAYIAGSPNYSRTDEGIWKTAAYVCLAVTAYAFFDMFEWLLRGSTQVL
ncbi:MAG: rhomboid family intramembrane serine protease [Acidobacteriota bacterium]